MPTLEVEVSELVIRLRDAFDEHGHTQQSFADALNVGRQRAVNWLKGHNDIDMDRKLQLRIAALLGIPAVDVLRLHGLSVSDDVPDPQAIADLGPSFAFAA